MKKYNKNRHCPKCGETPIDKYISRADVAKEGMAFSSIGEEIGDTMRRRCPNCSFLWYELPLTRDKDL